MLALMATFMLCQGAFAAVEFTEDQDYTRLTAPLPVDNNGQTEIAVFFWYGCSHCAKLNELMRHWKQPAGTSLVHIPAVAAGAWEFHAKVYYAAMAVNGHDARLHDYLFKEIYDHGKIRNRPKEFFASMKKYKGADFAQAVQAAFDSPETAEKVKAAQILTDQSNLDGVPSVVVQGKWIVSGGQAQSYERLLRIVEYLVKKEQAAKGRA